MQDSLTAVVIETDAEAEACLYAELLNDMGIYARVSPSGDMAFADLCWLNAPPHYQVLVLKEDAERASLIITVERDLSESSRED